MSISALTTSTDAVTGLHFTDELPADRPALTVAEIRGALDWRPGRWTVVYVADRLARAETYRDAVNDGRKFGTGYEAAIRKLGAEHRVYARQTV